MPTSGSPIKNYVTQKHRVHRMFCNLHPGGTFFVAWASWPLWGHCDMRCSEKRLSIPCGMASGNKMLTACNPVFVELSSGDLFNRCSLASYQTQPWTCLAQEKKTDIESAG